MGGVSERPLAEGEDLVRANPVYEGVAAAWMVEQPVVGLELPSPVPLLRPRWCKPREQAIVGHLGSWAFDHDV
jgi:hypothetical protein